MTNYELAKRVLYVHNLYDNQNKIKRIPCENDNIFIFAHGYCALQTNEIEFPDNFEDMQGTRWTTLRSMRVKAESVFVPSVYGKATYSYEIYAEKKRKSDTILKLNLKVNDYIYPTFIQQAFLRFVAKADSIEIGDYYNCYTIICNYNKKGKIIILPVKIENCYL